MKNLSDFLNEAKIDANNVFYKICKSKSLDEFKTNISMLHAKVSNDSDTVKTKQHKYYANYKFPGHDFPTTIFGYELSSQSSDENQYFIAFAIENVKDPDSDDVAEFEMYPRIYFGNNKKMIEYKWNANFEDVGWDYVGGRKGINAAVLPTDEVYEMPADLINDCIADLDTFKGKNKKY